MSWINKILPEESEGDLKNFYEGLHLPGNSISNFITAQSLRPESIGATLNFEKSIVYSHKNKFPLWFIEAMGMYISYLNGCEYFIEHHDRHLKELIPLKTKVEKIRSALAEDAPEEVFDVWEQALMSYAKTLTLTPAAVTKDKIEELRICGLEDDEILEATQIISYFNYKNRIACGLGINIEENI